MWIEGEHILHKNKTPSWDELEAVKGKISPDEARVWFAKFCKSNLYFTTRLLLGVKLAPVQELKLRTFFMRDFVLDIEGRGSGKSFIVSIFIVLYAIFYPGCKIGICSATFRQSKLIYVQLQKFLESSEGDLFRQCCPKRATNKSPDYFELKIGKSTVTAVPLTEKIRGFRFNVVIIDELLLVSQDIIDRVIMPFLSVNQDGLESKEVYEAETKLIEAGEMEEKDRIVFPKNKIIGLSSASFKFESLYKDHYKPYMEQILDPTAEKVNHALIRLSYEVAPPGLMNLDGIENARKTTSSAVFDREYRAIFTEEGSGYFNPKDIAECSLKANEEPTVRLVGITGKKYILSIDPNYSQSETADNFAMALIELDEETKTGTLVHGYAVTKLKTNQKAEYFNYLLNNFNIVYIIIDNASGPSFISDAELFLGGFPKPISQFPDTFLDGELGLREARKNYSYENGRIIHSQLFNKQGWIRLANDYLVASLEHRRIRFAGQIRSETLIEKSLGINIPIKDLEFYPDPENYGLPSGELYRRAKQGDMIDRLNNVIEMTKHELILIEAVPGANGQLTFRLPIKTKVTDDPTRPRRDSYTALLLANWGMKCYYEIHSQQEEELNIFIPRFIGTR